MGGETLDALPTVISTIGFLATVAVTGLGLVLGLGQGVGSAEEVQSMSRAITAAFAYGAAPLVACLGIRVGVRLAVQGWRDQHAGQVEFLVRWVDGHYRTVTPVELLARLLARDGDPATGPLPLGAAAKAESGR